MFVDLSSILLAQPIDPQMRCLPRQLFGLFRIYPFPLHTLQKHHFCNILQGFGHYHLQHHLSRWPIYICTNTQLMSEMFCHMHYMFDDSLELHQHKLFLELLLPQQLLSVRLSRQLLPRLHSSPVHPVHSRLPILLRLWSRLVH